MHILLEIVTLLVEFDPFNSWDYFNMLKQEGLQSKLESSSLSKRWLLK